MTYPTIDKCFSCPYANGYGGCSWTGEQKAPCEGGEEGNDEDD